MNDHFQGWTTAEMNEISGMDHSQSSTADSKGQINYGDVVAFCDESEAKGYADQSEKEPGESAPLPAWPFRVMKSADR
jgi:hypothetical protein